MNKEKISCSVGILSFNSERGIRKALESVKDFAEIIICDGGSTDKTTEIAKEFECKIIFQDQKFKYENNRIRDFSGVRNQMLEASNYLWFFYVDSDESLTNEVVSEVREIIEKNTSPSLYWVPRKYVIDGKIIDCASTYPSKQMRFFHREAGDKFIKTIHERIDPKPDYPVLSLKNFMLVPQSGNVEEIRKKWDYYVNLECERRPKISFMDWLKVCLENLKISLLFAFRSLRNIFFCRGSKMLFALEWERHRYHFNLCKNLFKNIKL